MKLWNEIGEILAIRVGFLERCWKRNEKSCTTWIVLPWFGPLDELFTLESRAKICAAY